MVEKKEEKKEGEIETIVVEQLPTQAVSKVVDENGNEFNVVTRDEALTEILKGVRKLLKMVA